MPSIIVPGRSTYLSAAHTSIDWQSQLTRGLLRLYNFSLPLNASEISGFGGGGWTTSGTPLQGETSRNGGCYASNGTTNYAYTTDDPTGIADQLTLFCDLDWLAGESATRYLIGVNSVTTPRAGFKVVATKTPRFTFINTAVTTVNADGPAFSAVGDRLRLVATYDGATMTCYVNGVAGTPASQTGSIRAATGGISINRDSTTTGPHNDLIRQFGVVARAWSNDEVQEWTKNPTSIFLRATSSRRYFLQMRVAAAAGTTITPSAGSMTLTGAAPTVTQTANVTVTPSVGTLTLTGQAPTVALGGSVTITPSAGAITAAGYAPVLDLMIATGKGSIAITGAAPTVANSLSVTPSAGSITLTGKAPTVAQTANVSVTPTAGAITVSGYAPTVAVPITITPSVGTLTLAGVAPTVALQSGIWTDLSAASTTWSDTAASSTIWTDI